MDEANSSVAEQVAQAAGQTRRAVMTREAPLRTRRRSCNEVVVAGLDDRGQFQAADEVVNARKVGGTTGPVRAGKRALRVLVADDNCDGADILSMILKLWGHGVCVAYAGSAALQLAFAYQPDVLLLDVAMPRLSGYDLARRIRREACFEDALLIAVTGYADQAHRLLGEAAGFDHYLVKPFEVSDLEKLLSREQDRLADSAQAPVRAPRMRPTLAFDCDLALARLFPRLFAGGAEHNVRERQ
jgi:CheY-like chemotaxis protein